MWGNTVLVFSADNGGPAYWSIDTKVWNRGAGANNWPLKGGKTSNFEGGTRVAAFVTGGFVPASVRGTKSEEYIHMADWYGTFARLAGVDPEDHQGVQAGLPPVDSVDVWPMLTGRNTSSARTEIPLCVEFEVGGEHGLPKLIGNTSALIMGDYKLLTGPEPMAYWQGPAFPTASSGKYGELLNWHNWQLCGLGCLYNIREDPTEQKNLALHMPGKLIAMRERLQQLRKSQYQERSDLSQAAACAKQIGQNGGFYGPWMP